MEERYSFYDDAKKDVEESETYSTKEERFREHKRAVKMYRRVMGKTWSYRRVLNEESYEAFQDLSRRVVELGEFLPANVIIDARKDGEGVITLETDMLLLEKEEEYTQTIAELFRTAERVFFVTKDNALPQIEFTFKLYNIME